MRRRPTSEALPEEWRRLLVARGLKLSGPRGAVVGAFFAARAHLTLSDILILARTREPSVASATVYRAMKLLEEAGLVERHDYQGRASWYEATVGRTHHDHLICDFCDAILEFESPEIERLQEEVARDLGFTIEGHRHEIYGICADCQSAGQRPARSSAPLPARQEKPE